MNVEFFVKQIAMNKDKEKYLAYFDDKGRPLQLEYIERIDNLNKFYNFSFLLILYFLISSSAYLIFSFVFLLNWKNILRFKPVLPPFI